MRTEAAASSGGLGRSRHANRGTISAGPGLRPPWRGFPPSWRTRWPGSGLGGPYLTSRRIFDRMCAVETIGRIGAMLQSPPPGAQGRRHLLGGQTRPVTKVQAPQGGGWQPTWPHSGTQVREGTGSLTPHVVITGSLNTLQQSWQHSFTEGCSANTSGSYNQAGQVGVGSRDVDMGRGHPQILSL